MKITKISDVLKGTDVLEGTINGGGGGRVDLLAPRSSWCLTATLLTNENSLNLGIWESSQWVRLLAWEKVTEISNS